MYIYRNLSRVISIIIINYPLDNYYIFDSKEKSKKKEGKNGKKRKT